jgi:hypothetical protein
MENKKEILSYWVRHPEGSRHYFKWCCGMLWTLVKYRVIWGMDISFTVTKSVDREEYLVQFFAE